MRSIHGLGFVFGLYAKTERVPGQAMSEFERVPVEKPEGKHVSRQSVAPIHPSCGMIPCEVKTDVLKTFHRFARVGSSVDIYGYVTSVSKSKNKHADGRAKHEQSDQYHQNKR